MLPLRPTTGMDGRRLPFADCAIRLRCAKPCMLLGRLWWWMMSSLAPLSMTSTCCCARHVVHAPYGLAQLAS